MKHLRHVTVATTFLSCFLCIPMVIANTIVGNTYSNTDKHKVSLANSTQIAQGTNKGLNCVPGQSNRDQVNVKNTKENKQAKAESNANAQRAWANLIEKTENGHRNGDNTGWVAPGKNPSNAGRVYKGYINKDKYEQGGGSNKFAASKNNGCAGTNKLGTGMSKTNPKASTEKKLGVNDWNETFLAANFGGGELKECSKENLKPNGTSTWFKDDKPG